MTSRSTPRRPFVRPALATALLLSIPLVMNVVDRNRAAGDGWHWGPGDFVVMGALLFGAGLAYEVLAGRVDRASKAFIAVAIALVVFAVWLELAVGGVSRLVGFVLR